MSATDKAAVVEFGRVRRLQIFWVRHRWVDVVVATVLVIGWLVVAWRGCSPLALTRVPAPQRQATYQIIATIAGTMGGFTLTSVSVLVNLLRTPMSTIDRLLPASDKRRVGDVVINVLPILGLSFGLAILGVLMDSSIPQGYWFFQAVVATAVLTAFLALARVVWVLRRLLTATTT
ncbi:hypothetical protein MPY17_13980 [Rhodococcus opacus]|uniref:hypothetical protein n=1 Tax=Rhodococcus opacus TaxID=37919 RepID=UPI001FF6100F|nr:hypothetical protein [Rhodococcus opacus]UOT06778.1 hypothetical protein MPY17_13980 [Rhodococcus opacus]